MLEKKNALSKPFSQKQLQARLGIHLFNWDANSGFTVSTNKKNIEEEECIYENLLSKSQKQLQARKPRNPFIQLGRKFWFYS